MSLKAIFFSFVIGAFSLVSLQAMASGEVDTTKTEKFNAGEVILHHVQDVHQLHFFIWHINLPIIIWDEGLQVFSSKHFYEGEVQTHNGHEFVAHEGYALYHEKIYKMENGHVKLDETGHITNKVIDLSITKNVLGMFLGVFIMFWLFLTAGKRAKQNGAGVPRGAQALIEPLVVFVRDEVAKPSIGHKYQRYLPFLLSLFFYIWIGNKNGLLPFLGGMNFTGNIAVTMVLALFVFVITTVSGNKNYWSHIFMPPGVPLALYPILVPIEIVGMISKPFVLMLRLFANITAGHIIILAFTCLIFIMNSNIGAGAAWGSAVAAVLFSVFMNFLELLVAFLQAYVFLLLAALYFGSAVEEHH